MRVYNIYMCVYHFKSPVSDAVGDVMASRQSGQKYKISDRVFAVLSCIYEQGDCFYHELQIIK